ncbi:MAG: hypothetical protein ACM33T_03000 [Solirubrobacterales bacterium]
MTLHLPARILRTVLPIVLLVPFVVLAVAFVLRWHSAKEVHDNLEHIEAHVAAPDSSTPAAEVFPGPWRQICAVLPYGEVRVDGLHWASNDDAEAALVLVGDHALKVVRVWGPNLPKAPARQCLPMAEATLRFSRSVKGELEIALVSRGR